MCNCLFLFLPSNIANKNKLPENMFISSEFSTDVLMNIYN